MLFKSGNTSDSRGYLACVASVSVWFRSKERPRNGIPGFGSAIFDSRSSFFGLFGGELKAILCKAAVHILGYMLYVLRASKRRIDYLVWINS